MRNTGNIAAVHTLNNGVIVFRAPINEKAK